MMEEMVGCCGRVKYVSNLYGCDRVYVRIRGGQAGMDVLLSGGKLQLRLERNTQSDVELPVAAPGCI